MSKPSQKSTSFRLPPSTLDTIRRIAAAHGCSQAAAITWLAVEHEKKATEELGPRVRELEARVRELEGADRG